MCCDGGVLTRLPVAMREWGTGKWADPSIALGLFAIGLLLYQVDLYLMWTDVGAAPEVPLGVHVALLAVLCVIDTFRRVRPGTALAAGCIVVAVDAALSPTLPIWLVLTDLAYAAVLYGSERLGRLVCSLTAVVVVMLTALAYLVTEEVGLAAGVGIVAALFFGTPVWWALIIRRQIELTDTERERSRANEALAALDREAAVAHERATMARDLHDVIAGHLSAIAIHSEAALSSPAGTGDDTLRQILEAIRAGSVAGLSEMRSMIELLHAGTSAPDPRSAPPRLTELPVLVDAARAAGRAVHTHVEVDGADVPGVVDHTAYRIAHEAITNALKHAPGAPIDVSITMQCNILRIDIRNPLTNAPTSRASTGTHGLVNMRHRAELLGGTLDARHEDGHWAVCAHLPVRPYEVER